MTIEIDIFATAGQSNEVGQAQGSDYIESCGFKYNYDAAGEKLSQLYDPTGTYDEGGDPADGSAWPKFANEWNRRTGRRAVLVPVSVGGSFLLEWTDDSAVEKQYHIKASTRINAAIAYFTASPDYNINKVYMSWCQGEAEAISTSYTTVEDYQLYTQRLVNMASYFNTNASIEKMFITRTGSIGSTWTTEEEVQKVRDAQNLASQASIIIDMAVTSTDTFLAAGKMEADELHYTQVGQNEVAIALASYIAPLEGLITLGTGEQIESVLTDSLVAYYPFENNYLDWSGYNNTLIPTGTPSFNTVSPKIGSYDLHIPANDFVKTRLEQFTDDLSVSGWFRFDLNQAANLIGVAGLITPLIKTQSSGQITASISTTGSGTVDVFGTIPVIGQDYHLCVVIDDTAKTIDLFIDNVSQGIEPYTGTINQIYDNADTYIGWSGFEGNIDQLRFHRKAIDLTTRTSLFNEPTTFLAANTVLTPSTPLVTNQNNYTNTFEWTAGDEVELSIDNGILWNDEVSPYEVGNVNIPIGNIKIRVKAIGINPVSLSASNTIAFTFSTLKIQDDTGFVAGANSYTDATEFRSYWLDRGVDYTAITDNEIEAKLVLGWQYVDSRNAYKGQRLNGRTQTTEFPRLYLYDLQGSEITGIPYEIKEAQIEYAKRELDGVTLQDDSAQEGNIKRIKKKIGPLEKEFEYSPSASGGELKNYPTADNKIPYYFIANTSGTWGHN